jgi:DNA-binding NarL/FixJ family response regulator
MSKSQLRVLLVDDFEPWRRYVVSVIAGESGFQIVGQATDGREAITKAGELQPDLILIDIGLPKLNGIAAAREIRRIAPRSQLLFVSGNQCPEIVCEAFKTGARGYVLKSDAAQELVPALNALVLGKTFKSRRFANLLAQSSGVVNESCHKYLEEGS